MSKTSILYFSFVAAAAAILLVFSGCAATDVKAPPEPTFNLSPFQTLTPAPTTAAPTPTPSVTPSMTATPVTYSVAKGDTLSSIAQHFGTSVKSLLANNPELNPQALTVGQVIKLSAGIPSTPQPEIVSTEAVDTGPMACAQMVDGVACNATIHNSNAYALENITARITLIGEDNLPIQTQECIPPLNILPSGESLAAGTFFKGAKSFHTAKIEILSATKVADNDPRYLQTAIQNSTIVIAWDQQSASISGSILLMPKQKAATSIWLAANAYDSTGRIIAYRRWEWSGSLQPGSLVAFSTNVYGPGYRIDHITISVEAHP